MSFDPKEVDPLFDVGISQAFRQSLEADFESTFLVLSLVTSSEPSTTTKALLTPLPQTYGLGKTRETFDNRLL